MLSFSGLHHNSIFNVTFIFQNKNSNILLWKWWMCTWFVSPWVMVVPWIIRWLFSFHRARGQYLDAHPLFCHWSTSYLWVCCFLKELDFLLSMRTPLQARVLTMAVSPAEVTVWDSKPMAFTSLVCHSNEMTTSQVYLEQQDYPII